MQILRSMDRLFKNAILFPWLVLIFLSLFFLGACNTTRTLKVNGERFEVRVYSNLSKKDVAEISAFLLGNQFTHGIMSDYWYFRFSKEPLVEICYQLCENNGRGWKKPIRARWGFLGHGRNFRFVLEDVYALGKMREYQTFAITTNNRYGSTYFALGEGVEITDLLQFAKN